MKDVNVTRLIKKIKTAFDESDTCTKEEAAGIAEATGRIVAAIITNTKKEVTL
ncbi:hypothetical protein LCGC14_0960610 [marine sediment metagenome]|uniref:Uncharacterized protein n=1 Tax=marine sediment metagenome TaxID=412755 RepID=A0A0F9RL45_9ZZZZ